MNKHIIHVGLERGLEFLSSYLSIFLSIYKTCVYIWQKEALWKKIGNVKMKHVNAQNSNNNLYGISTPNFTID